MDPPPSGELLMVHSQVRALDDDDDHDHDGCVCVSRSFGSSSRGFFQANERHSDKQQKEAGMRGIRLIIYVCVRVSE